jgi:HPt (histidine-containing phosphotransfer) domain-containing protein
MEQHINLRSENRVMPFSMHNSFRSPATQWKFINLNYLDAASPGNHLFLKEMLKIFKTQSISFLESVIILMDKRDFAGLAKTAHAMKPTGSYIGVDSLTRLVTLLEKVARLQDDLEVRTLLAKIVPLVTSVNEEIDHYLYAA